MQKLNLTHLDVKDKKVLMRVDFNVPLSKDGTITDDTRIKAALTSIRHIIDHGGALILMSHLGRPKGKLMPEYSLAPCAKRLSELLNQPVTFAPDCIGYDVEQLVNNLKPKQVILLENLRFHKGEENPKKDPTFAKELAKLGDFYVNDAFGTAHRSHASTTLITNYFEGKAAAGFLLEQEMCFLSKALSNPSRPFYALIGGAKISSKIGVLKSLVNKVDGLLIGGGMAYTFYKSKGIPIGKSIHDDDYLQEARDVIQLCLDKKIKVHLPIDTVVAKVICVDAAAKVVDSFKGIPDDYEGVDVGPKTIELFSTFLKDAATVFWNGPLGVFEYSQFAKGTNAIAEVIAQLKATTIVGGGDSIAALKNTNTIDKITHLSTGGGATLEFIEFGTLPGIEALTDFE
jgi:phosphoglycerate kinase